MGYKTLQDAASAFNAGDRSDKLRDRLAELTGGRAVVVLAGDKIDSDTTAAAVRFAERGFGLPDSAVTVAQLWERLESAKDGVTGNALTGRPLFRDATAQGDDSRANFGAHTDDSGRAQRAITDDERRSIAWAALTGSVPPSLHRTDWLLYELRSRPDHPEFARWRSGWAACRGAADAGDPDAAGLVARVTSRLAGKERPVPVGDVRADPTPRRTVLILHHDADAAFAKKALYTHLFNLRSSGVATLLSGDMDDAEVLTAASRASVVLVVLGVETQTAPILIGAVMAAKMAGIRVIPVAWKSVTLIPQLHGLVGVPADAFDERGRIVRPLSGRPSHAVDTAISNFAGALGGIVG